MDLAVEASINVDHVNRVGGPMCTAGVCLWDKSMAERATRLPHLSGVEFLISMKLASTLMILACALLDVAIAMPVEAERRLIDVNEGLEIRDIGNHVSTGAYRLTDPEDIEDP